MSRWFRHYAGMMRDEKLVRVSIKSKQPIERVLWIWGAILESAAEVNDNGKYDLDAAEVAYFLRADETDIHVVLTALADAGRVADNGVVNWGNRQFSSDKSAVRVAAYRERKRAENSGFNSVTTSRNGDVTLQERFCNGPETETETETHTETKKKKEEANASSPRKRVDTFPCPDGVDPVDWDALKANRKAKRAALTEGAYRQITAKLERWGRDGWPPGPIVAYAAERGWTTVFETDDMKGNSSGTANRSSGQQRPERSSLARAIDEGLDWLDGTQASLS